jgi:hypothetical protein
MAERDQCIKDLNHDKFAADCDANDMDQLDTVIILTNL